MSFADESFFVTLQINICHINKIEINEIIQIADVIKSLLIMGNYQ